MLDIKTGVFLLFSSLIELCKVALLPFIRKTITEAATCVGV